MPDRMTSPLLNAERQGFVLTLTLTDPERRNALTDPMVAALSGALARAAADPDLRAVVLRGAGTAFCAGADLAATIARIGEGETGRRAIRDVNAEAGALFAQLAELPVCTVAVVHGPAMGGGFGLAACADIVLGTPEARFSLSETTLGLVPAQIAPYVASRIGARAATRLALTAARLDGRAARALGIVDELAETPDELERRLAELLAGVGRCARGANADTKALFRDFAGTVSEDFRDRAAEAFLARLDLDEGREGVAAFIGKRRPSWAEQP